ncbi:pyruvate dehydrogenase complex dihydrolipoamide acetyltransferase component (E2) [Vermiconidia calcicola]|uniref:Pyruvate dehydrogenase complex dihydrolipoamide acetyltransferase component (E2) n=1 Tax=Vermiconidia calcicola TaxID=1690605 RepID=A0ACC3MZK2_9PEZI|nr:pyruvate dehydrogenase complex dihydrolipoamide acetyltransferase component (E2) [Vermiconidia calcicola]
MSAAAVLARASRGATCHAGALSGFRSQDTVVRRIPALSALARYYASKSFPSHNVISMPALSPTMTAGNIGTWQKKPGDSLAPGDVLVEIETDKAQMDFEFQDEGFLAKILKDSGEKDVAVGNPIAVMVEEEGDVAAFEEFTVDDAGGNKSTEKKEEAQKEGGQEALDSTEPPSEDTGTAPAKEEAPKPQAQESESSGERLQTSLDRESGVSPAAKKLALEKGVPVSQIKGSGPGGRVTKQDVEKYKPSAPAAAPSAGGVPAGAPTYEDIPASSMRKTIAARLTQSMNQNPHYFVASSVSVSKLLKLRQALNSAADGKYKLSVNDFMIKAVAAAARKVPAANSSWREESSGVVVRQHNNVDVSVAVATPIGLMTPIVKNVNGSGLESISAQIKDLGKRARDGKLKPEEYQGGTITISNMGMNEAIDRFTAVINPPQACIVAVGAVKKVAIPKEMEDGSESGVEWDEQIVLTGSFDHKVVDGAVGGEYMRELKNVIENPLGLML